MIINKILSLLTRRQSIYKIFFNIIFLISAAGVSAMNLSPVGEEETSIKRGDDLIKRVDDIHKIGCDDWITAAWATMLMKQNIVSAGDTPEAARAVLEMIEMPGPERKDGWGYFMNTQAYFNQRLGNRVGGNLMVVRTTPPARQTIYVRQYLLKRMCQLYDMEAAILNLAEKHKSTIMPGYTHERHAQPTTFGHYLLSAFDAVLRSIEALNLGYHQMSLNEMGCGALAGTSWNIDRNLVSDYLGMEGLIENTNDAVSYTDGYLVVVSGMTNITNILSRVALELAFWSGEEFGFVEIGNRGTSFLMPQKSNNPNGMEILQLKAGQMTGYLMATAVAGLRIPHGDTHHMLNLEGPVVDALTTSEYCILNMTSEINKIQINEKRMLSLISESYIASTELANQIVRDYGLDYRTAHEIVNKFVLSSEEKSIPATAANAEIFDNAAKEVIGKKLEMSDKRLREILSPEHFVNVTNSNGGVAPLEVGRMIEDRKQLLEEYWMKQLQRIESLEKGQKKMISDLNSFIK